MKRFVIIGLGSFGFTLARELSASGHEVLVVDSNETLINRIKEEVAHAIIADAKDTDNLKDFINDRIDAVVLNLGESLEETVLVTLALKKLGVENIIVKVSNEDHGVIMRKLGATEIVLPEKDYAKQMAKKLTNDNLLDYLPLSPEYGIYELALPNSFVGKRLNEINLRNKYNVSVVAIHDILKNKTIINPQPDFKFMPDMILYLLGKSDDIMTLKA